ncbi:MAG: Uma2 family endonuclease [Phormidium tanganyikae FI6-MK23]|jgi:Uma2 family endonuclease|nr:Uma2 family endonuclease [Phormidium tanganyikae FI6-MK23]
MTQAKLRFSSFEEYLAYDDNCDRRYQLIDGELVELPPESEPNDWMVLHLRDQLIALISRRLLRLGKCEIQVPVLQSGDAANRYPDLVVLREEHLEMTQKRLTITLEMPPPQLVAEVISPGKTNRERDLIRKRAQYEAVGIPEYWLIDPIAQTITVLKLELNRYIELGIFSGQSQLISTEFPNLQLTAETVFQPE